MPSATRGSPLSTLWTGVRSATPCSGLEQAVAEGVTEPCRRRDDDHQRVEPIAVGLAQIGVQLTCSDDQIVGAVEHAHPLSLARPTIVFGGSRLAIVHEHHL